MKGIIGAVIGDIAGSLHESFNTGGARPQKGFELITKASKPTDDTMCTCAVAKWLLNNPESQDYLIDCLHDICQNGKGGGFGRMFYEWLNTGSRKPLNSFGNGSAMRVSPVGWFAKTLDECLDYAERSAIVTHNHPEGIKGAQSVAACIFLTRLGFSKAYIRDYIENTFNYDLHTRTIMEQTPDYKFYVTCQMSVPQSIQCWLESNTYEETIRKAIMMGGDTDTMGAIAGSIAAATTGMEVPDGLIIKASEIASWPENGNEMIDIINKFHEKYEV